MQKHLKQLRNNGYQDENGVLKVPVITPVSSPDKNLSVNPLLKK